MASFEFQMPKHRNSIIKVIGVGGGGGNAVNNMFTKGIKGVDFVVCNTDVQALEMSPVPNKIRLGSNQTEGLGAGANPELGRLSALESLDQLREVLKNNTKMVFITAGMGGGTGTGGAPVIANLAREMGILTVAIVTTPFRFEGKKRMGQAHEGIAQLRKSVDTIITINNDNLTEIFGQNVTMKQAFEEADTVLCDAAKGIAEIITLEGYINVDFADVNTIMKDGGTALMGTATYSGDDRAIRGAEDAISSPLLDNVNIHGSRGILVNITASADSLRLDETTTIVEYIQEAAGDNADIIFGTVYDEDMGNNLSVTVIATGFDEEKRSFGGQVEKRTVLDASTEEVRPATPTTPTPPPAAKQEDSLEDFSISSSPAFTFELEQHREEPPVQGNLFERDAPPESRDHRETREYRETPPPPREQTREEALQDRIQRLKSSDYDYHNPERLKDLEDQPAYMRKRVSLESQGTEDQKKLSRLSIEEIEENHYRLNDNNSFLHDQVD
ncbi:MAG: cell division protein FtsZ [Bacteroidota bacterium]